MSKDSFWFKHDNNARNDTKIVKLRRKFGMEGYGVYFALVEIMRGESDYKIDQNEIEDIAFDLRVDQSIIEWILQDSGLFKKDGKGYVSERLKTDMKKMDELRKKRAEAGRKGGKSKANAKQMLSKMEANAKHKIRVDKSREDKKRLEERKKEINRAPSLEKVSEYFIQHKTTVMTIQQAKDAAKKFFNKYDATEWKMNGQQITRWTGLAANFISNYSANLKDQNGQPIQTGGVKPRYDDWK